jgi:hypothetical protein
MTQLQKRGVAAEVGRFLKANVSSVTATGLDWALMTALTWAGVHYLVSVAVGSVAGAATDFLLKRHWAFDRATKGGLGVEGLRYLAVSGSSLAWNLVVAYALVDGLRLPAIPGAIAASVIVGVIWNYPLHRFYVFRQAPRWSSSEQLGGAAGERRP